MLPWLSGLLALLLWPSVVLAQDEAPQDEATQNEAAQAEEQVGVDDTDSEVPEPAYGPEATPAQVVDGPALNAESDEAERQLPDYDGREDVTTAGDVLIWIPRILVSPLYFVSEFIIRRPLGFIVTGLEEEEIPSKLIGVFTFGDEGQTLVVPTAFIEFGFRPSFGVFFRTSDFLLEGHSISAAAGFGGLSWTNFTLSESFASEEDGWEITALGRWLRRPDGLFYGLGPNSLDDNDSRYAFNVWDGELAFDWNYWRAGSLGIDAGIRSTQFDLDESCCDPDDPDISARVADGNYELPPGYPDGYEIGRVRAHASIDTRPERPEPGSGVRISGEIEYAFSLSDPGELSWIRYGGSVTGFVDLTGWQHVLSLTLSTQSADAIHGAVPFTELVDLGGIGAPDVRNPGFSGPMRGIRAGRLTGESGIAAVLEYRWPIWVFIDGSFQIAMGNTFDGYLDNFEIDNMRMSFAWGLKTVGDRGNSFEILVGFGTEPFGAGGSPETFRLAIGTSQAF